MSGDRSTASVRLQPELVDRWRARIQSARANEKSWTHWLSRMEERATLRPLILASLTAFLEGHTPIDEFRREFDSKSRSEWDCYGLGGMSGAMWLNKLVKHILDRDALTLRTRAAFRAPTDATAAHRQGTELDRWLQDEIKQGHTTKGAIQPARAPVLLSAFWHFQAPTEWPIAYQSLRTVFQRDQLVDTRADGIEQYLQLRAAVLSLASSLEVRPTDIEFTCLQSETPPPAPTPSPTPQPKPPAPHPTDTGAISGGEEQQGNVHAEAQFMLATIAQKLGLRVWIARNDRNRTWNGTTLGTFSPQDAPSFGIDRPTQRAIELIDVLWIKGKSQVVAAFEVESTTSIYSGLLRMSDLAATAPNISFPLYIVVPEARMEDVEKQLRRPTFQQLELHSRCGFFSIEDLRAQMPSIMRFGGGPDAIEGLAQRVPDVGDDAEPE